MCHRPEGPYTQVTHLPLGSMPLAFTAGRPLPDRQRIPLSNVTTGVPLNSAGGCYKRTAGFARGLIAACVQGIFSTFPLCTDTNALEKSTKCKAFCRFLALTPSVIRHTVRICPTVNLFFLFVFLLIKTCNNVRFVRNKNEIIFGMEWKISDFSTIITVGKQKLAGDISRDRFSRTLFSGF